jgi:hypothetical protein
MLKAKNWESNITIWKVSNLMLRLTASDRFMERADAEAFVGCQQARPKSPGNQSNK